MSNITKQPTIPLAKPTTEAAEFAAGVARGRAQVKSGQTVPGDQVADWVNSWDTDNELPRPRPGPQP